MAEDIGQEVLEDLANEVEELSEDDLRQELKKLVAADAKRKARQAEYNKSPEASARRKEYYEKTKDQRVAYRKKYNAKKKMLLAKASQVPGLVEAVEAEVNEIMAAEEPEDV